MNSIARTKSKTGKIRLNYLSAKKLPFEKVKAKNKSSFNWSSLGLVVLIALFFVSLRERAWSGAYALEMNHTLDQVSKMSYENQLIFEELSNLFKKENFESIGLKEPQREFIILSSISRK